MRYAYSSGQAVSANSVNECGKGEQLGLPAKQVCAKSDCYSYSISRYLGVYTESHD